MLNRAGFLCQERIIMKFRHHLARKFKESKQAPLWKWIVIIFLIIAMPLFFAFVRMEQIQQVLGNQEQTPKGNEAQ